MAPITGSGWRGHWPHLQDDDEQGDRGDHGDHGVMNAKDPGCVL